MFPINILLVDDHKLFAKSLAIVLDEYPEIEKLYIVQNLQDLDRLLCEEKIDIILMDINLGNLGSEDGLEIAADLLQPYPLIKIVILTGYDLPVYRYEAKKIGASGFLNKSISPGELADSLIRIFHGSSCFPPENKEVIIEELTETERKILQLISTGKKRKSIADELYMSERTLSNHLQHIFEKLDVSSAVEAVTKALRLGYISPL